MSKKIIHFQVPMDEDGQPVMTIEDMGNFVGNVRKVLPKDYLVLCSPLKVSIDGDTVKFDIRELEDKIPSEMIELIKNTVKKEGLIAEVIK